MKNLLRQFGLWLAGKGGWVAVDCSAQLRALALAAEQIDALHEQVKAARHQAEVAEAARAAFEASLLRVENARLAMEETLRDAVAEREKAAGALRAYSAPGMTPLVFHRAKQLVKEYAGNHGISGEAKRHQVYARLMKEFPQEPRKDLGLAIEMAVR